MEARSLEPLLLAALVVGICILVLQLVTVLRSGRARPLDEKSAERFTLLEGSVGHLQRALSAGFETMRGGVDTAGRGLREELSGALRGSFDSVLRTLEQSRIDSERRSEQQRALVDRRLEEIRTSNEAKLEEMRQTVDERLHGTLEQRLGQSFAQVTERLEQMHQSVGEMQALATSVGDLKRVLTNVNARGAWGEMQLGALLEQILAREQYETNVEIRPGTGQRVEFAVKLPEKTSGGGSVLIPIDAKFPHSDYERLMQAVEDGNKEMTHAAGRALEASIRASAKQIADKYIEPPRTTDFALLFLPLEGLFAEVLRRPGLAEALQRDHRVIVAGPTTIAALLNSLQVGFRSLAIQRHSTEVWEVLATIKSEFGLFGVALAKARRRLELAKKGMDDVDHRTQRMNTKLTRVEQLPAGDLGDLLELEAPLPSNDEDDEDELTADSPREATIS